MVEIIGGSIWFLVNFLGVSDIYMLEICIVAFYSVNPCSYHFLGEQGPRQAKRGWTNCATRHRLQLFSYACSTKPLDTFASFHAIVLLSVRTKVTGRLSRLKVTTSQHVTLSSCDPFFETF